MLYLPQFPELLLHCYCLKERTSVTKKQKEMHFLFCSFLFLVQNTRGKNFIPVATALAKASISVSSYICKNVPAVAAGCFQSLISYLVESILLLVQLNLE